MAAAGVVERQTVLCKRLVKLPCKWIFNYNENGVQGFVVEKNYSLH